MLVCLCVQTGGWHWLSFSAASPLFTHLITYLGVCGVCAPSCKHTFEDYVSCSFALHQIPLRNNLLLTFSTELNSFWDRASASCSNGPSAHSITWLCLGLHILLPQVPSRLELQACASKPGSRLSEILFGTTDIVLSTKRFMSLCITAACQFSLSCRMWLLGNRYFKVTSEIWNHWRFILFSSCLLGGKQMLNSLYLCILSSSQLINFTLLLLRRRQECRILWRLII